MRYWQKFIEALFLIFIFILPWQIKFIWHSGVNNFLEISFYLSQVLLLLVLLVSLIYFIKKKPSEINIDPVWYLLAAFELFILISIFLAEDRLLAGYHYGVVLLGFALYFLLQTGFKQYAYQGSLLNRSRVMLSFILSMFMQAILGIYQFVTQKTFACKFLGLAEHNAQSLGVSVIETSTGRWLRAYGGMDHPNIFGGVLVINLLLIIYFLINAKIINNKKERWFLVVLFCAYFLSIGALVFTFSRSAWLAFFFSLLILTILLLYQAEKAIFKRLLFIISFTLVFFVLMLFVYQELLFSRVKMNNRLEQISLTERQEQLDLSLVMIRDNLLLGSGVGNYLLSSQKYQKTEIQYAQPVHNAFLLLFAESGVFAFTVFLSIFWVFIRYKKRQILTLPFLLVLIILMMLDHWLISLPFGVLFLFFVLGMI